MCRAPAPGSSGTVRGGLPALRESAGAGWESVGWVSSCGKTGCGISLVRLQRIPAGQLPLGAATPPDRGGSARESSNDSRKVGVDRLRGATRPVILPVLPPSHNGESAYFPPFAQLSKLEPGL